MQVVVEVERRMLRPRAAKLKNAAVQILPAEKKEKGKNKTGKGRERERRW